MHQSVFKLYSQELSLQSNGDSAANDESVMQTFARGMALFQGDSPDVAVKGKAPTVQSAASNWKMFCHLFQACSAYAASIASKVQGRSVVTVETLRSIQVCADCAHSSIAVETLQRRLTLQQFRDMYALHAERMTVLLCEMEQAYPASSAEWAVGLAGLQSLCAAAQRLPQAMLGPILSTAAKFARFGVRPVPAPAAKARSSGANSRAGTHSGTGKVVAREAAQLTLRVLCPEGTGAVVGNSKAKKGAKPPDGASSPSPSPTNVSAELAPVLAWFWADCALQAEDLGLSRESVRGGWEALAALSPAAAVEGAGNDAWDRTSLVCAAAETQVAALSGATEDVGALQNLLARLREPSVADSLSIGGGSTLGDWEFLSYLPVLCLRNVLSISGRKGVCGPAVEQCVSALSQVWAAVQGLLVQKPVAKGAPLDAKQASQLGARLNCFSRGLAHVTFAATAQLKQDGSSCKPWLSAFIECALSLLGRTLLDAKCVPIVRRGLGTILPLLGPGFTVASEPSVVCLSLASLLKSLFGRARDLPEPERMEICAVASACAVVCGNGVLKLSEESACDACASLLVCVIGGSFALQAPAQRVSLAAKRAELLRLLSRCLVHRPTDVREQEPERSVTGELSGHLQTALGTLVGGEHRELRAELKLVFSGLYLHVPAASCASGGVSTAWVRGRLQAVLRLVCDAPDFNIEMLILTSCFHWGGVAPLTVEAVNNLLGEVKLSLTEVDPEGSLSVLTAPAAAQRKVVAIKAKKETASDSAAAQLPRACWRLRLWTLRAAWTDVELCEASAGSGKFDDLQSALPELKGRCLVAAVQALRSVETLLQKGGQAAGTKEELLEACHAFVGCGRMLFVMLYLGGRLIDTACLFRTVSLLVTATDSVVAEISALADDFRTQLNVLSVHTGVFNKAEELALVARFAAPAASSSHAGLLDRFCLVCLALLHSSALEERRAFVKSVVGTDVASDERCFVPTDAAEFATLCKQVHRACSQRQQQQQQEVSGDIASSSWKFLSWVCAMASKVMWIAFQDVAEALVWGAFANSCARAVIESSGATVDHVALARLALVEVLLQRAELYEHCGNLDSAFAYLREVNSAAKALRSSAVQSVVSLHTVRVWYRASSPRLHNAVADLVGGGEERIYSSSAELRDEASELARTAATAICALFPAVAPDDEGARDATARDVASLRFRYLDRYWDVEGAQGQLPTECVFNCLIPGRLKARLHALLNPSGVSISAKAHRFSGVLSTSGGGAGLSEFRSLLAELAAVGAFDAIRDVRRRLCLASLSAPKSTLALDPFLAFVAGAASCGVAVECWEQANSDAKDSLSSLLEVTKSVSKALLGCADSAAAVREKLDNLLQHSRSTSEFETGGSPALSFLCTDRSAGVTLVGRYCESGPMVVALPLMDPGAGLSSVLQSWDEMQERSKNMLRHGLDVEQAARLSEEQKRSWWATRQNFDAAVEASMSDLQDLLGPWRILLSTQSLRHGLYTRCTSALNDFVSDYGDPSGVLPWLTLVCAHVSPAPVTEGAKVVAPRTLLLSRAEAVAAVAQVLAHWRNCTESEMTELAARLISAVVVACDPASPSAVVGKAEAKDLATTPPMTSAELQSLKVAELRVLLKDAGLDSTGKKQDLVTRLEEHILAAASLSSPASSGTVTTHESVSTNGGGKEGGFEGFLRSSGHLTVLLDEQLQRMPLETMPCLRAGSCSRVPSFALLLKIVAAAGSVSGSGASAVDGVSEAMESLSVSKASAPQKTARKAPAAKPKKTTKASGSSSGGAAESGQVQPSPWQRVRLDRAWYALDIEGNLPLTRSTLQPFLGEYQQRWKWTGVVATVPPEQTTKSLHESSDLFIFCGHGAGEAMCDPFRLRRFASCPAALLWGCSSGVLRAQGVHDALGTALYYLLAGAPFLVANLWDVTDKDIDKLCMAYMTSVFAASCSDGDAPSVVAAALAQSRGVCRMANAVGSAPVLYGVPLAVHDSSVL